MAIPAPDVRRDGDSWTIVWPDDEVGFAFDRLRESSDGLPCEFTARGVGVETNGHLYGPVKLNLLSSTSQTAIAKAIATRVNHLDWHSKIVQACAIVASQFREPAPTIDLSQMADFGGVDYLVPQLVPRGETTLIYGDGESCKSMIALAIGLACREGTPLPWGTTPNEKVNVLVLDWETNDRTVHSRLYRLAWGAGLDHVPQIHYRGATQSGLVLGTLEQELPTIRAEISRLNIGLVIVDSIGFACSGPLTEDQTARSVLNALRLLAPATRLVVAHVSAETARQSSGRARPFGSAFFFNGMRSGVEVRRSEDGPASQVDLGLFHRKANDGEHHRDIGLSVRFENNDGPIRIERSDLREVPDLLARTATSERIRAALRAQSKNTAELADELSEPENKIRVTLSRMADVIRLEQGSRGKPAVWGLSA